MTIRVWQKAYWPFVALAAPELVVKNSAKGHWTNITSSEPSHSQTSLQSGCDCVDVAEYPNLICNHLYGSVNEDR